MSERSAIFPILWILRNLADLSDGTLRVCAAFDHPRFFQTTHLLCLTVLVLVFSLLDLFTLIKDSKLEKIELCTTIHASFHELEPSDIPFKWTI